MTCADHPLHPNPLAAILFSNNDLREPCLRVGGDLPNVPDIGVEI